VPHAACVRALRAVIDDERWLAYWLPPGSATPSSVTCADPGVLQAVCDGLGVALACRTSTCIIAGLHGAGHLHRHAPLLARGLVDEALAAARWPQWLTDYALRARDGAVP